MDHAEAVDSMGYQLHNLYGAFEQSFDDTRYHADLIRRMRLHIHGIRPALLSEGTAGDLDELRRFRHLFRHAYGTELDSIKVGDLAAGVTGVRSSFARDFERFLSLLRPEDRRPDPGSR